MTSFNFKNSGGGNIRLTSVDSKVLGQALANVDVVTTGSVFRPATGADRDALVKYLNSMDFAARTVEVELRYPVDGDGIYRVNAIRNDTQDELDAWIEDERKAMAKRLGLKDPLLITLTITEI